LKTIVFGFRRQLYRTDVWWVQRDQG
jgi:hypothetical protein